MTVYAIGAMGTGLVKIGFTAGDPKSRLSDLQVGCPHKLVLIGQWVGGEDTGTSVHQYLKAVRVRGEWFNFASVDWFAFLQKHKLDLSEICRGFNRENLTKFSLAFPLTSSSRILMIHMWSLISITETSEAYKQQAIKKGVEAQAEIENMMQKEDTK